ncbi:polysaccharide deacetylase family protein [Sneathiella chinensis]|uniref:Chitooligosaccharide deacetylase n=1 Tax=Sneathiella chinensis TaxID=349750 RepID=A0ABQ5U4K2_9PROT|nr:polysaccharide deacetylase family protein [Sneathiella chinensis]GLQ06839.1 putative polysaccharide deacetylase [Sneathiella chinensis]
MRQPNGWGPEQKAAALNITFDNLGPIAEEQLGLPREQSKDGTHPSIAVLPDVLKILGGLKITYFIEGWNCTAHPQEIKAIREAGHEIGVHGWQHENWSKTEIPVRKEALTKAVRAYRDLGIDVAGFRPPGGLIDLSDLKSECEELGLTYASPLGQVGDNRNTGGFVTLPFAWQHVDAYMLNPDLGALRQAFGDPEKPYTLDQWGDLLTQTLHTLKNTGTHATLIFHPFILGRTRQAMDVFKTLIEVVKQDGDIWTPTCRDMAHWIRKTRHPD